MRKGEPDKEGSEFEFGLGSETWKELGLGLEVICQYASPRGSIAKT